jgi:hypothetical protein
MCAKMNWDRVRKENQSMRFGSTWIGADGIGPTPGNSTPPRKKKEPKKARANGWVRMSGCSCGKTVGFTGSHKKLCPISKTATKPTGTYSDRNNLTECVKGLGAPTANESYWLALKREIQNRKSIGEEEKRGATRLIEAVLEILGQLRIEKQES